MQADPLEKPSEKNGGGESLAHPDGLFKRYWLGQAVQNPSNS